MFTDDQLYQALLNRDPAFDGRVFVAVKSTGIFCRLTCPARKPLRQNCSFLPTVGACIEAGFRPCKRCHPMRPEAECDPVITKLMAALEQDPARLWRELDIMALGLDPSTVRRAFKRQFGITFLEMARLSRLRDGFDALANGDWVIDAQHEAGFASPDAFRAAFARYLGLGPSDFCKENDSPALLRADWFDTPLGAMIAVSSQSHLHLLEFSNRKALPAELKKLWQDAKGSLGFGRYGPTEQVEVELAEYFEGERTDFTVPLALHGTDFTKNVWRALQQIPAGQIRSYGQLAEKLGRREAVRAVARANGANQIAILIPCHRVVGTDGSLTGYGGGLWRKQKLIELERAYAS